MSEFLALSVSEDGVLVTSLIAAIGALGSAVVFLWKQQSKIMAESIRLKDKQLLALREREKKLEERCKTLPSESLTWR